MNISLKDFFKKINRKISEWVIKGQQNSLIEIFDLDGIKYGEISSLFILSFSDMFVAKVSGKFKETNALTVNRAVVLIQLFESYKKFILENESDFEFNLLELIIVFDYLCITPELITSVITFENPSELSFDELINIIDYCELDDIKTNQPKSISGKFIKLISDYLCVYSKQAWCLKIDELIEQATPKRPIKKIPPINELYSNIVDFDKLPFDLIIDPKFVTTMCKLLNSDEFIYSYSPNAFPLDLLIQMKNGTIPKKILIEYLSTINWMYVDREIKYNLQDSVRRSASDDEHKPEVSVRRSASDDEHNSEIDLPAGKFRRPIKSIDCERTDRIICGDNELYHVDECWEQVLYVSRLADLIKLYIVRFVGIKFNEMKIGKIGNRTNISFGNCGNYENNNLTYTRWGDTLLCLFRHSIPFYAHENFAFKLIDDGNHLVMEEKFEIY